MTWFGHLNDSPIIAFRFVRFILLFTENFKFMTKRNIFLFKIFFPTADNFKYYIKRIGD